jgi:hypothetical protein
MLTPLTDPINRRINIELNVWNSELYSKEVPLYLVVEYDKQSPTIEIFEAKYIANKLKNAFGETSETVKMAKVGGGLYVLMGNMSDSFDFDRIGYIANDDLYEFVNDQRRSVFDNKTKQVFKDHSVYITNPTILVKTSPNVEELKEMPAISLPTQMEILPIKICS